MQYKSTRNNQYLVSASEAIIKGLADDGGLFVPTSFPTFNLDWNELKEFSYQEMATFVLRAFLDDFSAEQVQSLR